MNRADNLVAARVCARKKSPSTEPVTLAVTPKEMADWLDRAQTVLDHAAALLDDEAEILLFSQSAPAGLREWPVARFEEPAEAADGRLFDDLRTTARSLRTLGKPRKEAP